MKERRRLLIITICMPQRGHEIINLSRFPGNIPELRLGLPFQCQRT